VVKFKKVVNIDKTNNTRLELLYTLKTNYFIATIVILFILLSHSDKSYVFSQSENLTFEDNNLGIKFQYPEEWNVEGSNLYTKSITECTTLPCIRLPEITIDVSSIGSEVPLENYTKEQNETKSVSSDYQLVEINKTKVGDKDAFQHIYFSKLISIGGPSQDIIKYDVFIKEGTKLYKLSFTSAFDEFKKYLDSYKKILDNFQIIS
jgi:hypothetical protein